MARAPAILLFAFASASTLAAALLWRHTFALAEKLRASQTDLAVAREEVLEAGSDIHELESILPPTETLQDLSGHAISPQR